MKVFAALLGLVAAANAYVIYPGNALGLSMGVPVAYSGISALKIEPEITTFSLKAIEKEAEAIHPGYVAITPGAKHVAPLPYFGASHHVNVAKAPGTKK